MPEGNSPSINIGSSERRGPIDVRTNRREQEELEQTPSRQPYFAPHPKPRTRGYNPRGRKGLFQAYAPRRGSIKLLKQIAVAVVIFLFAVGVNNADFPFTGGIKSGMRYLLTTETDFSPVIHKVVKFAGQWSNVDWPILDPSSRGTTQPVISRVPAGFGPELPLGGEVLRPYGWTLDGDRGIFQFNSGIDILAEEGERVESVGAGRVLRVHTDNNGRGSVLIRHDERYMTLYANLCNIPVDEQAEVKKGQVIGEVETRDQGPAHIHFEVLSYGKPIDPLSIMAAY